MSRGEKPLDKLPYIAYNIYRSKQEEDKEMAIYNVRVRFTGYLDMQVEADSEEEVREIAQEADTDDVCGWDVDIEDCEREDD